MKLDKHDHKVAKRFFYQNYASFYFNYHRLLSPTKQTVKRLDQDHLNILFLRDFSTKIILVLLLLLLFITIHRMNNKYNFCKLFVFLILHSIVAIQEPSLYLSNHVNVRKSINLLKDKSIIIHKK